VSRINNLRNQSRSDSIKSSFVCLLWVSVFHGDKDTNTCNTELLIAKISINCFDYARGCKWV
jgi:hypothetical protein